MSAVCETCRKPKANYQCGLCQHSVCKSCGHFLGEEAFSFLREIPQKLSHSIYCSPCFDEHVSEAKTLYDENLEKAREIIIFSKDETKKTSHIKRKEAPYKVEDCEDEDETLLRLAFFAVEDGFNCLLDVQYTQKKIIVGSHKKTVFSATAIPVNVDPSSIREY